MALGQKLVMRQSQSLVMTPQLLQAIRLLQLSTTELNAFVESELERNPLLERSDSEDEAPIQPREPDAGPETREEGDWALERLPADRESLERDLGTDLENAFPDERPANPDSAVSEAPTESLYWEARGGGSANLDGDDPNLEAYLSAEESLIDHLQRQLHESVQEGPDRLIGLALIEAIDQTGYLVEPIAAIAARMGTSEIGRAHV